MPLVKIACTHDLHVPKPTLDRAFAGSPEYPLDKSGSQKQRYHPESHCRNAEQTPPILARDVA